MKDGAQVKVCNGFPSVLLRSHLRSERNQKRAAAKTGGLGM